MASKKDRIKSLFALKSRPEEVPEDGFDRSFVQRAIGDFALAPKLATIVSGLSQRELSLLAEPVSILNLSGGAGRYSKLVFSSDEETLEIRQIIMEYLVEPFRNDAGAIQLKMLWNQPGGRPCHTYRNGYELIIPFELDKKPSLHPWPQKRSNQTTLIPRHHYDTIPALSQVNSYIRKELGHLLFYKVEVNVASANLPQPFYKLLGHRPQLYDRIKKLAITINTTEFNQKDFNFQCEWMKEFLNEDFKEFTLTINTPSTVAKKILGKGKKIPWVQHLREMHVAAMNVFVVVSDDPQTNDSGEKVEGALTKGLCSKFRDLLGVYSNDTVFGRRFLVAANARPRNTTFTSSDGFIILNFPEDDFNAINLNGYHNIIGNRGSRLRLNITFRMLDFSPRLPKLFQFLTKNLVISELHLVILTTEQVAESLILDTSGIEWIQMMKNLAITEHFFLRAVFLDSCETCEFCKDEEMNELIHRLVPQLRKALLPSSTWKDLRTTETPASSQWHAGDAGGRQLPNHQFTPIQRHARSDNNYPLPPHNEPTASEKSLPLVSVQHQNKKENSWYCEDSSEERKEDEISHRSSDHASFHHSNQSRDVKHQTRSADSAPFDNEEQDELVRPKPLNYNQYRPRLRITPAEEWDNNDNIEKSVSRDETHNSQHRSSIDCEAESATYGDNIWPLKGTTNTSESLLGVNNDWYQSSELFDNQSYESQRPTSWRGSYSGSKDRFDSVISKYIQRPRPKINPYLDRSHSEGAKFPYDPDDLFQSDGFEFPDSPNYRSNHWVSPEDRRQSDPFKDVDVDLPSTTGDNRSSPDKDHQLQNGSQQPHDRFYSIDLDDDSRTADNAKTEKKSSKFNSMFQRNSNQATQTSPEESKYGDESYDSDSSMGDQLSNQQYDLYQRKRDRLKRLFRKPKTTKDEFYMH